MRQKHIPPFDCYIDPSSKNKLNMRENLNREGG